MPPPRSILSALAPLLAEVPTQGTSLWECLGRSYGWSGEAIDLLASEMPRQRLRFRFETSGITVNVSAPTAANPPAPEETGTALGRKRWVAAPRANGRPPGGLARASGNTPVLGPGAGCRPPPASHHHAAATAPRPLLECHVASAEVKPGQLHPAWCCTVGGGPGPAVETPAASFGDAFHASTCWLKGARWPDVLKQFLPRFSARRDRFAGLELREPAPRASPVLPERCLAERRGRIEVSQADGIAAGDHWLL